MNTLAKHHRENCLRVGLYITLKRIMEYFTSLVGHDHRSFWLMLFLLASVGCIKFLTGTGNEERNKTPKARK